MLSPQTLFIVSLPTFNDIPMRNFEQYTKHLMEILAMTTFD